MHIAADRRNRRATYERRRRSSGLLSIYRLMGGRRKRFRRHGENGKYVFVDVYGTPLWIILLSIICLNLLDTYFTGTLIQMGVAEEANPIMAFFLSRGITSFVVMKYVITAFSLIFMCLCKNAYLTKIALLAALVVYISVVIYEVALIYECQGPSLTGN